MQPHIRLLNSTPPCVCEAPPTSLTPAEFSSTKPTLLSIVEEKKTQKASDIIQQDF